MKGQNWDGQNVNLRDAIAPVVEALQTQQRVAKLTGWALSREVTGGTDWLTNVMFYLNNPNVAKIGIWASLVGAQEYGLFYGDEDNFDTYPIFDVDVPPPWPRKGVALVPNLRDVLAPFAEAMTRRRKQDYPTANDLAVKIGRPRATVAGLEGGAALVNPTFVRLMSWAQAVGGNQFGPYVIINGVYTEADLL